MINNESTAYNGVKVQYCITEPDDELTQTELERLIRIARDVKARRLGRGTIDIHATNGGLFIVGWKKAA